MQPHEIAHTYLRDKLDLHELKPGEKPPSAHPTGNGFINKPTFRVLHNGEVQCQHELHFTSRQVLEHAVKTAGLGRLGSTSLHKGLNTIGYRCGIDLTGEETGKLVITSGVKSNRIPELKKHQRDLARLATLHRAIIRLEEQRERTLGRVSRTLDAIK